MKKIMVIGVSAGVGKSTFARKLAKDLKIDVYHLDKLFWKAGWQQATPEEFLQAQRQIVEKDSWIIEGNYSHTFDIRTDCADTIIYLQLPLVVCLYRVIKRGLNNIGKTRPDMAEGCDEKLDWEFIKFILTTYNDRKEQMKNLPQQFPEKRVIMLKSQKAINELSITK